MQNFLKLRKWMRTSIGCMKYDTSCYSHSYKDLSVLTWNLNFSIFKKIKKWEWIKNYSSIVFFVSIKASLRTCSIFEDDLKKLKEIQSTDFTSYKIRNSKFIKKCFPSLPHCCWHDLTVSAYTIGGIENAYNIHPININFAGVPQWSNTHSAVVHKLMFSTFFRYFRLVTFGNFFRSRITAL